MSPFDGLDYRQHLTDELTTTDLQYRSPFASIRLPVIY